MTHSYTIALYKEGTYTFPSATVAYNYMDITFSARSNYAYAKVRSPSVLQILTIGIPHAWRTLVKMLEMIPRPQGKGQMVLTAIVVAIITLIAFMEYRNIRKWLRKGRAQGTTEGEEALHFPNKCC